MQASSTSGFGFLLFVMMLALAPIAISRSIRRLEADLHILAGLAVGFVGGTAIGALLGTAALAGNLGLPADVVRWDLGFGSQNPVRKESAPRTIELIVVEKS